MDKESIILHILIDFGSHAGGCSQKNFEKSHCQLNGFIFSISKFLLENFQGTHSQGQS